MRQDSEHKRALTRIVSSSSNIDCCYMPCISTHTFPHPVWNCRWCSERATVSFIRMRIRKW